jgi:hypothetical protein
MILSHGPEGVLESTARSKALGQNFRKDDYYPVLVDAALATKAREAMAANSRYGRTNSVPTPDQDERPHNLLRGLLRIEGHPSRYDCRRNGNSGSWIGYYYGFDEVARKNLGVVSSKLLEPTLIAGLRELTVEMLKPEVDVVDPAASALAQAQRRLADTQKSLNNILAAIERGGELDTLLKRMEVLEKEKADLRGNVEVLERKVRSTKAIGSGTTELIEMKSLLDADLSDNTVRNRLSQAIRRVVTRIDLSLTNDPQTAALAVRTLVEGKASWVTDPCPPKKTRKSIYIRIHFRNGGHRAIMRLPVEMLAKLKQPNALFTGRV